MDYSFICIFHVIVVISTLALDFIVLSIGAVLFQLIDKIDFYYTRLKVI